MINGLGNMLGIQIVGLFFGLIMIYFSYIYHRKNVISGKEFFIWFIIWIGIIIGSVLPEIVSGLLRPLTVIRILDLYMIIGIFILLALTFFNFHILIKNDKDIKKIVRKLALEEE